MTPPKKALPRYEGQATSGDYVYLRVICRSRGTRATNNVKYGRNTNLYIWEIEGDLNDDDAENSLSLKTRRMDDQDVQILVHISAPCAHSDDVRYRKQAHGLLNLLQDRSAARPSPARHVEEISRSMERTLDRPAPESSNRQHGHPSETPGDKSRCYVPEMNTRQRVANAKPPNVTPTTKATVQVGRTPAFTSKKKPLERPRTAPAVIKETPLALAPNVPQRSPRFKTPPSTVADSQPSHTSFKRALFEARSGPSGSSKSVTPEEPPRKRARTESPICSLRGDRHYKGQRFRLLSSNIRSSPSSVRPSLGLDGVGDRPLTTSSPSPPNRSQQVQTTDTRIEVRDHQPGAQRDLNMCIYEDERTTSSCRPLQSNVVGLISQSSQNRRKKHLTSSKSDGAIGTTRVRTEGLTLAYAERVSLLRSLPSSDLLVSAPRPPTSNHSYTSHLTSALSIIRSRLQPLSKYYSPAYQFRPIRPLERGFWHLKLPLHWDHKLRATFWRRLCDHVQRGKAGFGTRLERRVDGQGIGCSQGKESAFYPEEVGREQWRIWCWGEVHVEVWLLLYVDSGRAIRGVRMAWCDGVEEPVVQM